MPRQLTDMRNDKLQTVEDADACFARIAVAEIELAKKAAQAEARIAAIKTKLEADTETLQQELDADRKSLSLYIVTHQQRFDKPRKRKTSWGRYGLQTSSRVEIYDREAALRDAIRNCRDCVMTVLDLPACRKLVKDGTQIDGCEKSDGQIAHYTVDKALLDEAKEI